MEVDADRIDTMGDRLDATQSKVDSISSRVDDIDVGPQSMGVVGSSFAGSARDHLSRTKQVLSQVRDQVSQARDNTHRTAQSYRNTDAEAANRMRAVDTDADVPSTRADTTSPSSTTTTPSSTTTPPPVTTPSATTPDVATSASRPTESGPSASIGDRLDPPASTGPATPYQPSAAETALRNKKVVGLSELNPGEHVNAAYRARFEDGTSGVYKPLAEEKPDLRQGIPPNTGGYREVAAFRLDEQLGFGLVPPTSMTDDHYGHGPGSMQQFVDNTDPLPASGYPKHQQEQMAVLDYVMGNTDRHPRNYGTGMDGSPVAFDNGSSYPEFPDPKFGIRSDFVGDHLNVPLSPDVLDRVRGLDPDQFGDILRQSGIGDHRAVDGAVARLREIQDRGMITGEAWPGKINGARLNLIRGSLSS